MNYIPQQGGKQDKYDKQDTRQIKVELKKKTTAKKVHLNPKTVTKPATKVKKQTKKVRKFILGISKFHKRITRAKKVHNKIKELPLDKLKEKLIKEGLIKSTSKAPESVLRQIANDSELVNKQAL
jgi:predicted regulator of amino acid metabolism with ACT domain